MNLDEFAEYYVENFKCDDDLPSTWFDKKYCDNGKKCTPIIIDGKEYNYCDLYLVCKYSFDESNDFLDDKQIVKMWLESEV